MFPTFDVPPQHAETVGARKARKAKEEEITRRASSSTSQSSGSAREVKPESTSKKSAFGWGSKKKNKEIQEISPLPALKKTISAPQQIPEPEPGPVPHSTFHQEHSASQIRPPPYLPPVSALPRPPPSPGLEPRPRARIDTSHPRVDRLTSQLSHISLSPSTTTTSSGGTAFSGRSVFSASSGYDTVISEQSYVDPRAPDPRYVSNLQLEPMEREVRAASSMSDRSAKAAQGPFARALAKMESAGARIITARLSEEWGRLDDDESFEEVLFEKRLWALTAYQRLTQNKHLQSPAHEILSASRPADQRRILHLHGSLADGWMLATRYPAVTVYTTSSMTSFNTPTSYPAPLNHHSLYVPSLSSPMPFPDGYFDAIVSRSVSTVLRNDEWARSFFDYKRVLKPGGQIEILSVDAHLTSEGQRLSSWVEENIVKKLEAHGLSKLPSDTLLDTMEIVGLENIRRARVALPAGLGAPKARPNAMLPPGSAPQDMADTSRMMAFLGRHFYQDLYSKMMQLGKGEDWFWARKDIRDECERHQTKMVLTIACALKPTGPSLGDSYLDM